MSRFTNRIAFVVPTKDRPEDLRRMLESVAMQSHIPDEVIVVDGGDRLVEDVVAEFKNGLDIQYIRSYPPSLARQRNAGMAAIGPAITVAGYLDDDLVLEPDAVEALLTFWEAAGRDIGGAAFSIVNNPLHTSPWLKRLFLMDGRRSGAVLRSGYNAPIGRVTETMYVRWLYGGATTWRRQVIEGFPYDEWFEGTGFLEDVDYSLTVGRKYKLAVVAPARVYHFTYPIRKDRNYLLGKWQVINHVYLARKHPELSIPACCWALAGELVLNFAVSFGRRDSGRLRRALGNCAGVAMVASGRIERIGGVMK